MNPNQTKTFDLAAGYRADAQGLRSARDRVSAIHASRDIRAAGNEMEIPVRKVISSKLPDRYKVAQGHVIDYRWRISPQLDIIIADSISSTPLFQSEDGTEYVPFESVYAIGEVKTAYTKAAAQIQGFSETLEHVRSLNRLWTPENPLFTFMFFTEAGEFELDDIEDQYRATPANLLPSVICFLDKGVVLHARTSLNGFNEVLPVAYNLCPSTDVEPGSENHWSFIRWKDAAGDGAVNLMFIEVAIMQHLNRCRLEAPNLFAYITSRLKVETGKFI